MVSLQRRRRRKRRKKELSRSGRIVLRRSATGSRSRTTSCSCSCPRSDSTACAGASTAGSRAPRSESSACNRRTRRRGRPGNRRDRSGFCGLRFGRSDNGARRGNNCSRVRSRRLELDVLESLSRCDIARPGASTPSPCGARTPSAKCRVCPEAGSGCGVNDQKQNERMSKKRGSGSLPPPLSLARYSDRRPISSFYVDG
jgi:hypothetical protein